MLRSKRSIVELWGRWDEYHSGAGYRCIADRPCRNAHYSPHGIFDESQELGQEPEWVAAPLLKTMIRRR